MRKLIKLTDDDRIEIRLALDLIAECAEELRDGGGAHESVDLARIICSNVELLNAKLWGADILDITSNNFQPRTDYGFDHNGSLIKRE